MSWLGNIIVIEKNNPLNRLVDMHDWARKYYFHPLMGGRTSIKVVLPAVLQSNKSKHIEDLLNEVGLLVKTEDGVIVNPYDVLPETELIYDDRKIKVAEGVGAMRAYQDMVYGLNRDNAAVKEQYKKALLEYCRLDTLAMVIIWEHWMQLLNRNKSEKN